MATTDQPSFARMCRAFPVRTAVFTFGPLAVGTTQLLNALAHDAHLLPVAGIAAIMVVFSVLVTGSHLATYRRRRLSKAAEPSRSRDR